MAERGADEIQRDIEQARVTLASSVDQIAERVSPKRVTSDIKSTVKAKAQSPQGKAVIGGAGALVVILIIRRIRHRGK